ncbi:helix-turn-helix domain-containing protein [Lentzea sp. NPDC003310]|uniref:IclR family transcriptional regulator n=1 Tax=Lentzea sp. NPDC003310 TaxID=3154447 RepID=UPI0033A72516
MTAQLADGSAARVLAVLRTFLHRDASSLADLVRATGLPRSTVHRLLGFLVRAGLVAKRDGLYRLGGRPVAPLAAHQHRVLVGCLPELLAATGGTVQVSVLDGQHALVVERLHGRAAELTIAPGARLPAHCTAPGRVLLAARPGVAVDRGEWLPSVTGVAAGVCGPDGELVAALSAHGRAGSFRLEHAVAEVRRVARLATVELAR